MIRTQRGFVALLSVIIISFVLLLVAVTLNFSGFFTRLNIFDSELKSESDALADSCLDHARLLLAQDASLTPTGDLDIGDEMCEYDVDAGGEIKAWAEVNGAYTYYYAEVDLGEDDIPVNAFEECENLSPCP